MQTRNEYLAERRFWSMVDKNGPNGCWLFCGAISSNGYGSFRSDGGTSAHRYAYEKVKGRLPFRIHLHHKETCPKRCVNPDHMERVTAATHPDNAPGVNRAKIHCKNGHEFTKENTKVLLNGGRACRECNRKWSREGVRKHRWNKKHRIAEREPLCIEATKARLMSL